MKGKLLIFSAPSGSGKTTIVKHLLSSDLHLEFSISATSREIRGNEVDGEDYYFFTVERFRDKIKQEEFIEWEEVYKDHLYGTLKSEIERIWNNGNHVVFDVDVKGGINLKKIFGKEALSVFIMTPSINTLRERLKSRGTDTEDNIEMRIKKANEEINSADEFDVIIVNDNLEKACDEAYKKILEFMQNDK